MYHLFKISIHFIQTIDSKHFKGFIFSENSILQTEAEEFVNNLTMQMQTFFIRTLYYVPLEFLYSTTENSLDL